MTLQDDIDTIYKLDAEQNIGGRLYQKNTFGLWSDANKAYIKAAPLMVSTIRKLEAKIEIMQGLLENWHNNWCESDRNIDELELYRKTQNVIYGE